MLITAKLILFDAILFQKNSPKSSIKGQFWVWNHTEIKILEW